MKASLKATNRDRDLSAMLAVMFVPVAFVAVIITGCGGATPREARSLTVETATSQTLKIATSALPVGMVESAYGTKLLASGGAPPYSWRRTSGVLPTGLSLDAKTGSIAGTPAIAGAYSFAAQVVDSKANVADTNFSLNISTSPSPTISGVSPNTGPKEGGTVVTIGGNHFDSGAAVAFGDIPAPSVRVISANEIQAVTPAEASGSVAVTVQGPDGQMANAVSAFTFTTPNESSTNSAPALSADVIVDASQTLSETGRDDMVAVRNIYASASAPEVDGGLYPDWNLISSQFAMNRMRNINGLGDCAVSQTGVLSGCSRLNNDLQNMKHFGLTPHVVVGQWAPASIGGDPRQWSSSQWAQYDALCYAIVNYVANEYDGAGFNEALFEVENELDITTRQQDLWLTTSPNVPQGDPSRFTQFDTVYSHWAKAVDLVAQQTPSKKIRIAGPATGFWTVQYGNGQIWQNQIISRYAAQKIRLDVISLHFYGDPSNLAKYAQSIRATLNENGNSNAEIWISEWGASDTSDPLFGAINASNVGAAWAIDFLLQALKGGVVGGSFLEVRDNAGHDTAGLNSNINGATWDHVMNGAEYPKAIANAFSMIRRMTGERKAVTVNPAKENLYALASASQTSGSLIVSNYNYAADWTGKTVTDASKSQSVTVAFKNLPFSGPVTVDRYLIDAQTSNVNYWIANGKTPPSVQATQLQKVESFTANSSGGVVSISARDLGQSTVSLWVIQSKP